MTNTVRRRGKPGYLRCAFAGYRQTKMPFGYDETCDSCVTFKRDIHDKIEELIGKGYAHFLSGGAQGFDYGKSKVM